MMNSPGNDATIDSEPAAAPRYISWFRIAVLTWLGLIVVTILTLAGIQFRDLQYIKAATSRIRIGDSPKDVYAILGEAKVSYECGWPSRGAPPTEYGELYGGRLDYVRDDFEAFLHRNVTAIPPNLFNRSLRAWPVMVKYDARKRVTAVFIDSVKVK